MITSDFQIAPNGRYFIREHVRCDSTPKVEKVGPVFNAFIYQNPVMVQVITRRDKGRISIYI